MPQIVLQSIRDAIESVGVNTVEVHLSDIMNRDKFRKKSELKDVCKGQIYVLSGLSSNYKYVKNKWVRSNNTSEIGIITSKQLKLNTVGKPH